MHEKCTVFNSSDLIDQIVLVESSEAKESLDSRNSVNSKDSDDIESKNNVVEVML